MTTNMNAWAPEIDPNIPGLPEPALLNAIRYAARRFCEQTLLWIANLTAISVVANQQDYTLTVDSSLYGEIVKVDFAKFKATGEDDDQYRTLDPAAEASEDLYNVGGWKYQTGAQPTHFGVYIGAVTTLSLFPIPTEASTSGLLVRVCLKPTLTATVVPDFLYNTYHQTIALGALKYLYGMRSLPGYDPKESLLKEGEFRAAMNSAKYDKLTGATKRPLKVKLRAFV